ncbi:putative C6 finger domain protein [Aspergillus lentulus]|uniref:C6 finger domain protein n=1 Tax=Aspergillus lentulus TaxID=293939 RepID=A0ABQ1B2S9_ASPLE|nr:putative C6 finger domain protein [Aspergillus lentulus]GFF92692.1 putative C6 finger domain protein [Aspergillus lentulus]GFG07629.1 putative C6 finger domain protein [Aspergillus lentulus]
MPGARSSGCLLCVQRRVKCDERLPGCARCEKYGKPCPGYVRNFKFKAGKPYRSRRAPRADGSACERSVSNRENDEADRVSMIPSTTVSLLSSSTVNVLQGLSSVVDDLSQPRSSTSVHIVSRWFSGLPALYGRNETLDATVRCFTAHHISKVLQNPQMARYSRSAYIEALSRLRKSLNAPSERLSADIFCAVLLLCLYELFANNQNPDTWMKHAKAVSQLAEIRGPNAYKDPFNNTLLKAARGLIVMHSLFSGERCFLASDRWHAIMKQRINSFYSEELEDLLEEFIALFTLAPSLVHALYDIKASDMTSPATWKKASETLTRILEMQNKLSEWYSRFSRMAPPPYERLSSSNDAVYPIVLHYSDLNIASIFNSYHAYMAIIHEALRTLGYPGEHEAMVAFFRDQICKSVEYNGAGPLGPYRMGFPLRVAYEAADPKTKAWIENRLVQMSQYYAAVAPKNFATPFD